MSYKFSLLIRFLASLEMTFSSILLNAINKREPVGSGNILHFILAFDIRLFYLYTRFLKFVYKKLYTTLACSTHE
jgi:hypothetical protein